MPVKLLEGRMAGSQDYPQDPRNENVLVYVNGDFTPRDEARVSVFDSGFILGDGIWEGFRNHGGRLAAVSRRASH